MKNSRAAFCLIVAALAAASADRRARSDEPLGLCSPEAVAERAMSSKDLCPESGVMGFEERRACISGIGRYRAAMDAMCGAWSGRVPEDRCDEACGGNGFDFAAWSCRLVTDDRRFLRRCLTNGSKMAAQRVRECVHACRGGTVPGLPGALLPTRPADTIR